jgi:hypothetical protein
MTGLPRLPAPLAGRVPWPRAVRGGPPAVAVMNAAAADGRPAA